MRPPRKSSSRRIGKTSGGLLGFMMVITVDIPCLSSDDGREPFAPYLAFHSDGIRLRNAGSERGRAWLSWPSNKPTLATIHEMPKLKYVYRSLRRHTPCHIDGPI